MNKTQQYYSQDITTNNVNYIQEQIAKKLNYNNAYYATDNIVMNAINDMDHFPYKRFYRGVYYEDKPVTFEREAGFRERHDPCYTPYIPSEVTTYPKHCFEAPCSTVYPCYPDYLRKYADKQEMEVLLNRTCVVKQP